MPGLAAPAARGHPARGSERVKAAAFEYLRAAGADQAIACLADPRWDGMAKVCSGSQSLGPMLNLRLAQPVALVDVSRIGALREVTLGTELLRIGAAVTHARIEDGTLPDVTRGLLPRVAGGIAYRAVRNRGTLGGSLAHADPAADWVSTMCLLDAGIVLQGAGGQRRLRPVDFFLGPFTTALADDELLVAVEVPRFTDGARWAYHKVCRKPGEFAEAIAAAWVDPERATWRLALGALDGMPHVIDGQDALRSLQDPAAVDALLDDAGVHAPYERQLQRAMIRRALADLDSFPS